MIKRLLSLLLMLAISIDQFAQVIIRALPYVLFNDWKPSPNWTISGFLGALSAKGHPWAVFCAGLVDGVFGPGTGSFLVFLFVRVFGFSFLSASAVSKVVNIATNLGALIWFGVSGHIIWQLGLIMAVFNVAGSTVGSGLAIRYGSGFVRILFLVVVSVLIVKTGYDGFLK